MAHVIPGGYNDADAADAAGNRPHHRTGKQCLEPGCTRPTGTA